MKPYLQMPAITFREKQIYHLSWHGLARALEESANSRMYDLEKIKGAFDFAEKIHSGQKRISGHPFISHPLFVAWVLIKLNMDQSSIIAGLLHDVIETKKVNEEDISRSFGDEVALIVLGVTEIRKKTKGTRDIKDPEIMENFRRLILSSIDDSRVLIIRIIEKLHGALTIKHLGPKDQKIQAEKLIRIYAHLAEYANFYFAKREMEDAAFKVLYPKKQRKIKNYFERFLEANEKNLENLISKIIQLLELNKIAYTNVYGRRKGYYSTYLKIMRALEKGEIKEFKPSVVNDVMGITVLTKDVNSCYEVLGLIHNSFEYFEDEFDDYIANPKPNGYRSLQTTVSLGKGSRAEIQIKTEEMHYFNEYGPASHVAYKYGKLGKGSISWLEELSGWRNGKFKIKVFEENIYVFTPKRDVVQLPKGATPVDFACRIHGNLLRYCKGAKVNGKLVKLNHRLNNGDLVEIIKSKRPTEPRRDWLYWCYSGSTKSALRKLIKKSN
jgi:guanosine-3',5'-bis(diphosphate) 3'-pyrophosphohydrolase